MKGLEEFDVDLPNIHIRVPILPATQTAQRSAQAGTSAKQRFPAVDVPEDRLFTFSAEISNHQLDSWHTRMAESSLRNYAEDAAIGVAFLDSHMHHQRIGYSFGGTYEDEAKRVLADFYTVKGMTLGNMSTDAFIEGVNFALIRDVSIGFKEGEDFKYTCSICGQDIFSWDCDHMPGRTYTVAEDPQADPGQSDEREVMCFAWIENARLSEVSAVFDGATPNAMILAKATREVRGGRLKPDVQQMLERTYRFEIPKTAKQFPGITTTERKVTIMPNDTPAPTSGAPDNKMLEREVAFELRTAGVAVPDGTSILDAAKAAAAEVQRLRPLETQATEGQKLRAQLVEDTLAEGVRAYGNDFQREAKKTMLDKLDVDAISEMRASWKALGDTKLSGGRRSVEAPDAPDGDENGGEGDGEGDGSEAPKGAEQPKAPDAPSADVIGDEMGDI